MISLVTLWRLSDRMFLYMEKDPALDIQSTLAAETEMKAEKGLLGFCFDLFASPSFSLLCQFFEETS